MSKTDKTKEPKKVPPVAGFDKNPRDFFRSSRGGQWNKKGGFGQVKKDYLGFRRGSR